MIPKVDQTQLREVFASRKQSATVSFFIYALFVIITGLCAMCTPSAIPAAKTATTVLFGLLATVWILQAYVAYTACVTTSALLDASTPTAHASLPYALGQLEADYSAAEDDAKVYGAGAALTLFANTVVIDMLGLSAPALEYAHALAIYFLAIAITGFCASWRVKAQIKDWMNTVQFRYDNPIP